MQSIPLHIYDMCPSCHPRKYVKSKCMFIEKEGDEYLYACDGCGSRLWVSAEWAKENGVIRS